MESKGEKSQAKLVFNELKWKKLTEISSFLLFYWVIIELGQGKATQRELYFNWKP
jgi:hypothetical protein